MRPPPPTLGARGLREGKGRLARDMAALLGFVGMTTLPGLPFTDWCDSAIGQLYGVDG